MSTVVWHSSYLHLCTRMEWPVTVHPPLLVHGPRVWSESLPAIPLLVISLPCQLPPSTALLLTHTLSSSSNLIAHTQHNGAALFIGPILSDSFVSPPSLRKHFLSFSFKNKTIDSPHFFLFLSPVCRIASCPSQSVSASKRRPGC